MRKSGVARPCVLVGFAGVVVNVLVAAGCALWSPMPIAGRRYDPSVNSARGEWKRWDPALPAPEGDRSLLEWHTFEYRGVGVRLWELSVSDARNILGGIDRGFAQPALRAPATRGKVILYAGWPFRTLTAHALLDHGQGHAAVRPPPYWTPAWRELKFRQVTVVSGVAPPFTWNSFVNQLLVNPRPLPRGVEWSGRERCSARRSGRWFCSQCSRCRGLFVKGADCGGENA